MIRIGTRGSALALAQANSVASRIPDAALVTITTSGDRGEDISDKSRWTSELERALIEGEIDLAVHSAKDVPGELAEGLELLGASARAGAEDVICGSEGLQELPRGARVGTSSIRRGAQLRAAREDLEIVAIRGNVDTRLERLRSDSLDAIVLARAGLERLGREEEIGAVLDPARFVPSPGQGILALEGRAEDERVRELLAPITDERAFACLLAERALADALGASCNTPVGAHAALVPEGLRLAAWVGLPDGSSWVADELIGESSEPEALGAVVAARMHSAGAGEVLQRAQEMAGIGPT